MLPLGYRSLNMQRHLSQDSDIDEQTDEQANYHLARASIIVNCMLTVVLSDDWSPMVPPLGHALTIDAIKRQSRKFLRVATHKLHREMGHVFEDKSIHFDFLLSCLRSNVFAKGEFLEVAADWGWREIV